MAINAEDITTAITLELDREEIPLDQFKTAVEEFFGLVKEVAKESAPRKNSSAWLVKVYPGSAGIGVVGKPGAFTGDEIALIRTTVMDGLRQLEQGHRHPMFTDKAIGHSKKLSSLFTGKKVPAVVRIWGDHDTPFDLTKSIATTASQILEAAYEEDGSVEGVLEKLNGHGQFEFVIYDLMDNRPITCEVRQDRIKDAWAAWLRRVEVIGKVRYRKDGLPVSVKAEEIIPFPAKEDIPDLDTMRSLLRG